MYISFLFGVNGGVEICTIVYVGKDLQFRQIYNLDRFDLIDQI